MVAGLTDHPWTLAELLHYQVPLPPWVAPKRRGRPPKQPSQPALAMAASARLSGVLPNRVAPTEYTPAIRTGRVGETD